jgi:hypothetical protein
MKKVQTLTEEIQKMRKLMSFNINENSHDSLSEENIESSIKEEKDPIVGDCVQLGGPPEVAHEMENDLNDLLTQKLTEIEKSIPVTVTSEMGNREDIPQFTIIKFNDTEIKLEFDETNKGYSGYRPTWTYTKGKGGIEISTNIKVSDFKDELLKNKCYKLLYDRYDSIKNQIDSQLVSVIVVPTEESPIKYIMVLSQKGKSGYVKANNITLSSFKKPFVTLLAKNGKNKTYGVFGFQGKIDLVKVNINGAEVPSEWDIPTPTSNKCYCNDIVTGEQIVYPCDGELPERCKKGGTPIAFDFVVEANKNFAFDDAILTDEAKGIIKQKIEEEWNGIPQNRKDGYLDFIKDKKIDVNAYASIDALSNFKVSGTYKPCRKTGQLRKDYNKCLSQARAEAVVEYLKTIADGTFKDINFVANGMGETNQFSGLKWDNEKQPKTNSSGVQIDENSPYSTTETKSDRRFEVKFPKWHTED